jgi:hypothetical protein
MISVASIESGQDGVGFTREELFHCRRVEIMLAKGSIFSTMVCAYLSGDVSFNQDT